LDDDDSTSLSPPWLTIWRMFAFGSRAHLSVIGPRISQVDYRFIGPNIEMVKQRASFRVLEHSTVVSTHLGHADCGNLRGVVWCCFSWGSSKGFPTRLELAKCAQRPEPTSTEQGRPGNSCL